MSAGMTEQAFNHPRGLSFHWSWRKSPRDFIVGPNPKLIGVCPPGVPTRDGANAASGLPYPASPRLTNVRLETGIKDQSK